MIFLQFCVTGPDRHHDGFARPLPSTKRFPVFEEALDEAREMHEQFGDAFAIWYRDRIVGLYDLRGHVPLCPEFG